MKYIPREIDAGKRLIQVHNKRYQSINTIVITEVETEVNTSVNNCDYRM